MTRFTLSKQERLSSLKEIDALFKDGTAFSQFPFRIVWREAGETEVPLKVVFSVSKKRFSRAVDRNRIKRLMKESYRFSKPALYKKLPEGRFFRLGLIYIGKEIPDFDSIQKGLTKALERLITQIRKENQ